MDLGIILTSTFAFLFRALVAQPFDIPSAAMAPTLEPRDYVWATKFSYGYSNLSLPSGEMLPAFTFAKTAPQRGDVVIFGLPSNPSVDYIKRVIGLPGDTIAVKSGVVIINGTAVAKEAVGAYSGALAEFKDGRLFAETLPEGKRYTVLDMVDDEFTDNMDSVTIPPGHYFVMGDNRDNSSDSRFGVGFLPEANIIAKVVVIVTWPGGKFTMRDVK